MPPILVAEKILSLVNIALYMSVIIIGLNCIWRVQNNFDRFLKLLLVAIGLVPLRLMVGVAGFENEALWMLIMRILGFFAAIMLIIAFSSLLKTLKQTSRER